MEIKPFHPLMKSYSYQSPTRVVFGLNSLDKLTDELAAWSPKRSLIITGTSVCKNEAYCKVLDALASFGTPVEFKSIKPEPDSDSLNALAIEARNGQFDLVVGMGGGSTMDAAKVASLIAANEGEPMKYFMGEPAAKKGPPIVTIPTLAGTGSEVTPITVVAHSGAKLSLKHRHLYPALAIVDPVLAMAAPPEATASAGADALCHAIESIMSVDSNSLTRALCFEAINLVESYLEKAYCNGSDIEARNGLALASVMAGMAFQNTGLCLAHGIASTYALKASLPHGTSVALAEPYAIEFNAPCIAERLEVIAAGLGIESSGASGSELGEAIVDRILDIMCTLGLPSNLEDIKISEDELEPMVDDLMGNYSTFISKNPRKPSREDLLDLYGRMLEGY
jgi:alcohol dehydrogenase class IV